MPDNQRNKRTQGRRGGRGRSKESSGNGSKDAETTRPELERAEEILDNFGERLGQWRHTATGYATGAYARAREGAEDILAEAQEIRRRRQANSE